MRELGQHLDSIQPGAWIIGVSGGADSVALLRLILMHRCDITPIVAHVDHELRGAESDNDARFVQQLAQRFSLTFEVGFRHQLDPSFDRSTSNRAARLRSMRQRFFIGVCERFGANGVLLAHHADDQAETILLRLLRGGELTALAGIARNNVIANTNFVRPLLEIRRQAIEQFLTTLQQPWREDASNRSPSSPRSRVRSLLSSRPNYTHALLEIGRAAKKLNGSIDAPPLGPSFEATHLAELPDVVARRAGRRWLLAHGAPGDALTGRIVTQLIEMARDRAAPVRQSFPGGLLVERSRGWIRCRKL